MADFCVVLKFDTVYKYANHKHNIQNGISNIILWYTSKCDYAGRLCVFLLFSSSFVCIQFDLFSVLSQFLLSLKKKNNNETKRNTKMIIIKSWYKIHNCYVPTAQCPRNGKHFLFRIRSFLTLARLLTSFSRFLHQLNNDSIVFEAVQFCKRGFEPQPM